MGVRERWGRLLLWTLLTWVLTPVAEASAKRPPSMTHEATVADLGYPVASLDDQQTRAEFWLDLPGNWQLEDGGTFELAVSIPGAGRGTGVLVVAVNGENAARIPVPKGIVELETWSVPIPALRPLPPGLHVVVEFLPRGDDSGCQPPDKRTVIVREMTRFNLQYTRRPVDEDVEALPYPFAYPRGDELLSTIFVLDHLQDAEAVSQAAGLAVAIGRKTTGTPLEFSVVGPDTMEFPPHANVVVLGASTVKPDLPCRTEDGIAFCRRRVRDDRAVLWVMGDAEAREAMLEDLFAGSPDAVAARMGDGAPDPWSLSRPTFEDLGIPEIMAEGSGKHEQALYLRRPRGLNLGPGSSLHLHITRADDMDATVTASINDVAVVRAGPGSLDELGFVDDSLPMDDAINVDPTGMPADYLVLKLEIEQETMLDADPDCDPSVKLWTLIHPDSYFELDPQPPEGTDLRWFPYPFVKAGDLAPVRLIVDGLDSPMREDSLAAAMQVAAAVGAGSVNEVPAVQVESQTLAGPGNFVVLATKQHPWRDDPQLAVLPWSRPFLTEDLPIGEVLGSLMLEENPMGAGLFLIVDANEGGAEVVARALRRDAPRGVRVAVAEDGSVTAEFGSGSVLASWWRRLSRRLDFDRRHWVFVGTNVILLLWLRRRRHRAETVERPDPGPPKAEEFGPLEEAEVQSEREGANLRPRSAADTNRTSEDRIL